MAASLPKQRSAHPLQIIVNLQEWIFWFPRDDISGKENISIMEIVLTRSLIPIFEPPRIGLEPYVDLLESYKAISTLFELQSSPRRNVKPSLNSTCKKENFISLFKSIFFKPAGTDGKCWSSWCRYPRIHWVGNWNCQQELFSSLGKP